MPNRISVDSAFPSFTSKSSMDHEYLRKCAVRWLIANQKCGVVISEMHSAAMEIPDAVGWSAGKSVLVECKLSRADWHANSMKSHIRTHKGIGRKRYFLVPAGLVTPQDLEISGECYQGWGLLWLGSNSHVQLKTDCIPRETDEHKEILMLTSALRRVRTREFLTIVQGEEGA